MRQRRMRKRFGKSKFERGAAEIVKDQKLERVFTYNPASELLDEVNVHILHSLQLQPRLTMSQLARHVGMSSPAVTERVRRLEDSGVIRGYVMDIDPKALGLSLTAYVRVRPHTGRLSDIADLAMRIAEVVECHRITGDDCFILKVHLPSMEQLDRLLDRFLMFGNTTTSIVQSSPVPHRPAPLPVIATR